MKFNSKNFLLIIGCLVTFAACKKVENKFYPNGKPVTLSSSVTSVAAKPSDSANTVLTLNWSNPKYATDSSNQKFIIQLDSTGNFTSPVAFQENGSLNYSFTGNQLNNLLANFGFTAGKPFNVFIRVISSYANNNEQYTSNAVTVSMTPYVLPITLTPSSSNPLVLQITNAASKAISFNWNASPYGSTTISYALQIDTAGGKFTNPQVITAGDSLAKDVSVGDLNTAALLAGVAAGATNNLQIRVVAFQGLNTTPQVISNVINLKVTTYLPFMYLWVAGDYQGWSPSTAPQVASTVPDLLNYEGYVYVANPGIGFKFTTAPDWNHTNYGDAGNGKLSATGDNIKWPSGAGFYYVKANPTALTWSATKTTWAIIGDATPGGWGSDTQMSYDAANNVWVINSVALTANSLKFRANGTWSDPNFPGGNSNLGGNLNSLSYGGGNISVNSAGNYKIVLDLSHPLKYTATLTKL